MHAWRMYSGDKRTSPSPYFGREGDELEVEFYAEGFDDVVDHSDEIEACADFIRRETVWVLHHSRVK